MWDEEKKQVTHFFRFITNKNWRNIFFLISFSVWANGKHTLKRDVTLLFHRNDSIHSVSEKNFIFHFEYPQTVEIQILFFQSWANVIILWKSERNLNVGWHIQSSLHVYLFADKSIIYLLKSNDFRHQIKHMSCIKRDFGLFEILIKLPASKEITFSRQKERERKKNYRFEHFRHVNGMYCSFQFVKTLVLTCHFLSLDKTKPKNDVKQIWYIVGGSLIDASCI